MTILGSAIGCKQHCEDWVSHKLVKKLPILLSKLIHLGHAQSSFLLLLYCASFCKMVWFIRTIALTLSQRLAFASDLIHLC